MIQSMIKNTIQTIIIVLLIHQSFANAASQCDESDSKVRDLWIKFKNDFNKDYQTIMEENQRFEIFVQNLELSRMYNKMNPTAEWGITKYSDWTHEELNNRLFMHVEQPTNIASIAIDHEQPSLIKNDEIPVSFDWRNHYDPQVITPVKNQEQCGSCWAFSATETIESYWALSGQPLLNLSTQQSVDCCKEAYGCMGGWPSWAYESIIADGNGGIETESEYPYKAIDQKCQYNESSKVLAHISAWNTVTSNKNETYMMQWVYQNGPLSVCVDASTWPNYKGGIVMQACGNWINHCVQVVGYGVSIEHKIPYWIVRNSWGIDWGVDGYLKVYRGNDTCAIAQVVTAVTV